MEVDQNVLFRLEFLVKIVAEHGLVEAKDSKILVAYDPP